MAPRGACSEVDVKLDVKALAIAVGLLWGAVIFLVGMGSLIWPGYGEAFLRGVSSIYPGFQVSESFVDVLIGTAYGLLDGLVAGLILGCLYNVLRKKDSAQAQV
jgi:hypothetical protein